MGNLIEVMFLVCVIKNFIWLNYKKKKIVICDMKNLV